MNTTTDDQVSPVSPDNGVPAISPIEMMREVLKLVEKDGTNWVGYHVKKLTKSIDDIEKNTFDIVAVTTALAMFEYITENKERFSEWYSHGVFTLREQLPALAVLIDKCWDAIDNESYDRPFDLEFIPELLEKMLASKVSIFVFDKSLVHVLCQDVLDDSLIQLWSQNKQNHWDEHPDHPVVDWRYEVENNDTRLGYHEWVRTKMVDAEDEPVAIQEQDVA